MNTPTHSAERQPNGTYTAKWAGGQSSGWHTYGQAMTFAASMTEPTERQAFKARRARQPMDLTKHQG